MARQEQGVKDRKGVPGPKPKWTKNRDMHQEPVRSSDPGNRRKPEPLHMLLLTIMRKYVDLKQKQLARIFKVDQGAISGYLGFGDRMLVAVLPTPERFTALLTEFKKTFPDGAVIDGTHVRFRRPGDSGTCKDMYSDKTFTGNTILFVTPTGLIVAMNDTYEGRTADITATRQFLPQPGEFTKKILQDSRAGKEFKLDGDQEFRRLGNNMPGAEVRIPEKRPHGTKKGKPIPEQKTCNREFSRKRVIIESAIGEVKHFRRASNVYGGTPEEFREFNVMCGLANFRRMRRDGTYNYWMRILEEQAPLPPE